jgi:hypothetical protein
LGAACLLDIASKVENMRRTGDLVKIWVAVAVVIAGMLIARALANQPCDTATPFFCFMPYLYQGFKPFMIVASVAMLALGTLSTLVWLVRRR